jgi:hypothetical protein
VYTKYHIPYFCIPYIYLYIYIYQIPYTIYHIPYTIYHIPNTIYHIKPSSLYHIPYTIYHMKPSYTVVSAPSEEEALKSLPVHVTFTSEHAATLVTEQVLWDLFSAVGEVVDVTIHKNEVDQVCVYATCKHATHYTILSYDIRHTAYRTLHTAYYTPQYIYTSNRTIARIINLPPHSPPWLMG